MFYQHNFWDLNPYLNFMCFSKLYSRDTGDFVDRLATMFLFT